MKKILSLLSFLIPFIVNAQTTENVWLYGSTTNPTNRVTARNDFQVTKTFYLGSRDTTFVPTSNGAIVTRPQDGKPYIYEGGWFLINYGTYNLFAKNLIHASNDSTFRLGGIADTATYLNFSNAHTLVLDSLFSNGTTSGLKINLGGDAKWDLFERDSATGNLIPVHIGSVNQVLTVLSSGGLGYAAQQGTTNLGKSTASNSFTITSSTGSPVTINSATHIIAGPISGPSQARLDSTIVVYNPEAYAGDSLALASTTLDSLIIRKYLVNAGPGIILKDSSSLYQILKNYSVDTGYVIPKSTAANKIWGNPTVSIANAIGVGLTSPLGFSGGNIAITGISTVPMGGSGNGSYTANGLLLAGTTSIGAFQQVAFGTTGQVLTSNGAGVAPTMQNSATGFTSPMTTLGDIIFQGSTGPARLAGNITAVKQLLGQVGTGSVSAVPGWFTPGNADVTSWQGFASELISNKSTDVNLGASNTLYPSQLAAKTYIDNQASALLTLANKTISGDNNTLSNISEGSFSFTNVGTANVTIAQHGLVPTLPNDANKYFNGVGGYTSPVGTNIYNTDGSVSSATRTVTLGSNTLKFATGVVNFNAASLSSTGSVNYVGTAPGYFLNNSILDNNFTGSGGTRSLVGQMEIGQSAMSASNTSVTYTSAASLIIDGPPTASTNMTITNPYSLYISSGKSSFNGVVQIVDGTQGLNKLFGSDANGNASWKSGIIVDNLGTTGGSTPVAVLGAGVPAGGGATSSLISGSNSVSGTYSVITGTGSGTSGGTIVTITLPTTHSLKSLVFLENRSSTPSNTWAFMVDATHFVISLQNSATLTASTAYEWNYLIMD